MLEIVHKDSIYLDLFLQFLWLSTSRQIWITKDKNYKTLVVLVFYISSDV